MRKTLVLVGVASATAAQLAGEAHGGLFLTIDILTPDEFKFTMGGTFDEDVVGDQMQWLAVKYAYMDARRYANLRSLTLRGTQKIWDSSLAAIGMLWAKEQGHDVLKSYMDITFDRFWKRELDIEDETVVTSLLREAGADVTGFADYLHTRGREYHDQLQDEILDRGYFGVPTYVIDGEMYFGREHLPRVRWHLAGKRGPLPDVANDSVIT